jgi:hypothetical protein
MKGVERPNLNTRRAIHSVRADAVPRLPHVATATGVHRPPDRDSVRHHAPPPPPGLRIALPWNSTFGWEEERLRGAAGEAASGAASTVGWSLGRWIGGGAMSVPRGDGLGARRDPVLCGSGGTRRERWMCERCGRPGLDVV